MRAPIVQPVVGAGDFQRNATGLVVMVEGLCVVGAGGDGVFRGDGGADGPEVDWVCAVVCDDCVADGGGRGGQGGEGQGGEGEEVHFVVCYGGLCKVECID